MADSLYSQLKHARQVATTADATAFGVEIGIVTNVKDPDRQGRVKVCFPRLPGKPESDWARVAQPAAGDGRGFYWIPHVNDEVLIGFERGQTNRPFVIGSLWNGKDKPMKTAYVDENTTVMIQTKSGHQIVISDKNGEEKIIIGDMSGKRTVTFDVKAKKFLIEAKEGDVELHAEKKLVLECEDLEIKTSKTGKADIGTTFDLNISQKGGIQAGPVLNIKASKVELNPSGGAGAAAGGGGGAAAGAGGGAGAAAGAQGSATVPTHDVTKPPAAGAATGAAAGGAAAGAGAAPGGGAGGAGPQTAPQAAGQTGTSAATPTSPAAGGTTAGGSSPSRQGTGTGAAQQGAQSSSLPAAAPATIDKFWSERDGEKVKLNWKVSAGSFGSAEIRCPGETVSITDRMRSDAAGKHGYIHRDPKKDAGGAESATYTLRLLSAEANPSEIASQDLEVKAEEREGEKKWFGFEANEETAIKTIELAEKEAFYFDFKAELEFKAVGGGFEYDPNEKRDVADYLHEIAEKTPDFMSALKDRYTDFLYDDTSWAEFEFEDVGKPELTNKSGEAVEAKVNVSLKHKRTGVVLKGEFAVFEREKETGDWKFCQFSAGTEFELKSIEDVPFGHGMIWKTPALKAELTGKVHPNWKRIFEQVLKDILADVGAASLVELGAAGLFTAVLFYSTYKELKEAQALDTLPDAVEPIHEQLVSAVLSALCKNERPTDQFLGELYDRAAALADQNIKAKWLQKNGGASEDQYYEKIRSEIEADRNSAIEALNLGLRSASDQQRRGHLDDLARQLAFVGFAKTARRSEGLLSQAWVRLFNEPPTGKYPYDPKNPWLAGHYSHDPSVYQEVVKELQAGSSITGDLDKYLATADDGLVDVGASMGSAQLGGEIANRVEPLARRYLSIVLDAFAKLDPPDDADDGVVFEKLGVKLRENMKQKALADPNAGLDEASFYNGISAEVEKERKEGGGPLQNKLWPQMQELARIVLWFSYARGADSAAGRRGVWKALFGKWPEDSPNRRLFDQVDDILKYAKH